MMLSMFALWAGLYVVGFAMIVWPHLETYRTASGQEATTFVDALYYSGVTAAVLGYGDISPRTGGLKVLAFVEAGLGFAIISGVVTWLLNVVSGVSARDALALRMKQDTGGTHDGVHLIEHSLVGDKDGARTAAQLHDLTQAVQQLQPRLRQFPVLDVHYRSLDAALAPERMVQSLATAAIAASVLGEEDGLRSLSSAAGALDRAVSDLMVLIASEHLSPGVHQQVIRPQPEDEDFVAVHQVRRRLLKKEPEKPAPVPAILLACRLRLWLEAMDRLSHWRMDEPAAHEADRGA